LLHGMCDFYSINGALKMQDAKIQDKIAGTKNV